MDARTGRTAALLVVIVNWQSEFDTRRAVESVRNSTNVAADVFVVDNGSAAESQHALAQLLSGERLVMLPTNRGFAAGANEGIRLGIDAGYEQICLLNADAELHPDALALMRQALYADPQLGAVAPTIVESVTGHVQTPGGGSLHWVTGRCGIPPTRGRPLAFLGGTCLMLRAAAARRVGSFDERFFMYWEDVDLSIRLTDAGWQLGYVPTATVRHAGGTTLGRASPLAIEQYMTSMILFFRKHRRWWFVPVTVRLTSGLLAAILRGRARDVLPIVGAVVAALSSRGQQDRASSS